MPFDSRDVELLLSIARDASLGRSFSERIEAVNDALSKLIPHSNFSAIVLDLERRRETPREEIYYESGDVADLVPYTSHYIKDDPMFPAIPLGDGQSYVLSDFVPRERFGRDAFTADYLKLLNVRHVMGASQRMPSGQLLSIAIHREKALADFTAKEREILRLAVPDIVRAAWGGLLATRIEHLSNGRAVPASGAIVFTPEGEVAHSDETGLQLAAEVATALAGGTAALRARIVEHAARSRREGTTRDDMLRLARDRWVRLRLSTLRAGSGASVLALLEVVPPGSNELKLAIMKEGGLTPREREVAELASLGLPTSEIAGRLGVAPSTVNIHLHRLYAKLGVQGRSELASVLHGGPR